MRFVWFQVSGDVLDERQKVAFREYLEEGGGVVGIHGSGGDFEYHWDWYVETVIGAQFIGHPMGSLGPQFQEATIMIEDRDHPATRHLDERWVRVDEWYSFDASPRDKGVRVLATLDESTYSPILEFRSVTRDLRMGDDHPIIWSHCVGSGRVLYSALGHRAVAYQETAHLKLIEEGMAWAAGGYGTQCHHPMTRR